MGGGGRLIGLVVMGVVMVIGWDEMGWDGISEAVKIVISGLGEGDSVATGGVWLEFLGDHRDDESFTPLGFGFNSSLSLPV